MCVAIAVSTVIAIRVLVEQCMHVRDVIPHALNAVVVRIFMSHVHNLDDVRHRQLQLESHSSVSFDNRRPKYFDPVRSRVLIRKSDSNV